MRLFDDQAVIRHRFDLMRKLVPIGIARFSVDRRRQTLIVADHLEFAAEELFGLEKKQQLREKIDEQILRVFTVHPHGHMSARLNRIRIGHNHRQQGSPRLGKKAV